MAYGNKVSTRQCKTPIIKTIVKNLNLDYVKPQRAGVIMYTVCKDATYFGLGLDDRTHDLTDFGGTVNYKYKEDAITGALREFHEETLEIFDAITKEMIQNSAVIYDENNLIIFIHVQVDPDSVCKSFVDKYQSFNKKFSPPEVCGITWLSWEEFSRNMKEPGALYPRVQKFLARADDFSYLL
jgi:hypothetical protein